MQYQIVAVVVVLLGMLLAPTWAINCYDCDSGTTPACNDKFNSNGIPTMASTSGWCTKLKSEGGGSNSIMRSAAGDGHCAKAGCTTVTMEGVTGTDCCCNGDLCNSSGRLSSTMAIGLLLSLFLLTFKKLMF